MKSLQIEEAAIHDIEGTSFWNEHIEDIGIVALAVIYMHYRGDAAAQVHRGVELDSRLRAREMRPRK